MAGISCGTHYPCTPKVQKEQEKNMDPSAESGELIPLDWLYVSYWLGN